MSEIITVKCRPCWCGKVAEVTVVRSEYEAWQAGGLIQRVMPSLDESKRELLITGTCDECWEQLRDEDDDDDDSDAWLDLMAGMRW